MRHTNTLSRFRLILCSPKFPGNIGACARVAANFGITEIVLVTPACQWLADEARSRAVAHAGALLENARVEKSLSHALHGMERAIGFTRRTGKARAPVSFVDLLPDLPKFSRIALVFGNEETGLTQDELTLCTDVAQLSTDSLLPSLNLSHAVAVVLSRLHEACSRADTKSGREDLKSQKGKKLAELHEIDALLNQWQELLVSIGLTRAGNPERMTGRIREILHRAAPLPQDVKLLRGFLSKARNAIARQARSQEFHEDRPRR